MVHNSMICSRNWWKPKRGKSKRKLETRRKSEGKYALSYQEIVAEDDALAKFHMTSEGKRLPCSMMVVRVRFSVAYL